MVSDSAHRYAPQRATVMSVVLMPWLGAAAGLGIVTFATALASTGGRGVGSWLSPTVGVLVFIGSAGYLVWRASGISLVVSRDSSEITVVNLYRRYQLKLSAIDRVTAYQYSSGRMPYQVRPCAAINTITDSGVTKRVIPIMASIGNAHDGELLVELRRLCDARSIPCDLSDF